MVLFKGHCYNVRYVIQGTMEVMLLFDPKSESGDETNVWNQYVCRTKINLRDNYFKYNWGWPYSFPVRK